MADFEPTLDPYGDGIDKDESFDLPDAIMGPLPLRVQQELNTSGDLIQSLQGELRDVELEAQKKRLVDIFYKELTQVYGLRPDSIDYDQFRIDADGKMLYWTPGDEKNLYYNDEGRSPVPGVTKIGLEVWSGWYRCSAESAGTHRLHIGDIAERSE